MKYWTVQKLIGAGFAFVIFLSVLMCGFSVIRLANIQREAVDLQIDHVPGLYTVGQLQHHAQRSAASLYRLAVTENVDEKRKLRGEIAVDLKEIEILVGQLESTVSGSRNKEKELLDAVKRAASPYALLCRELAEQGNAQSTAADIQKLGPLIEEFGGAVEAVQNYDKSDGDLATNNITEDVAKTKNVVMVGSLLSLLACIAIAVSVVGKLAEALKKLLLALIQVNSSATEMAATLKQQQASANEVASTSVEIGATSKEISATTKELGKTMGDVAAVSEHAAVLATGGQTGLARLEGTMRQIMSATATISAKLALLNEKTTNIHSVVSTINKVADQTNLLSLNAAIEAEKAGEYGRGFGVVATEIRRLADQTAVATYDIEQMVKEMQSAVSAGVMGMDKFGEEVRRGNEDVCGVTAQLAQIIEQVQTLTPRFESVNEGMQTQGAAAAQISDALGQLGETAQQSAQALRQNSEAIDQLMQAAHGLQGAVSQFKAKA